ncbi:MAG: hypothetical protein IT535_12960 [Bauldia sp.]|nr:hypothetical protein [Bauldia sp.]
MSDPFRTTPGMIPPSQARAPSPRNMMIAFGLGTLLIAAASAWFLMYSRPDSEARERAVRQALGLAQVEEYVFAYPVTGTPIAVDTRCDRPCSERQLTTGKALVQTGARPQGFLIVDAPPSGCAFLTLRFSEATSPEITDAPLPVYLDAAAIEQLQRCNPDAPLRRNEGGLVQVPPWYRSTTGVAVSVPFAVLSLGTTFRAAVCAEMSDGSIGQFAGDENMADLVAEGSRYCANI